MKFGRIISIIVIALVLIAFFTNPKESDFNTFIIPETGKAQSAPLIEYKNNHIYSTATITFFTPITVNGKFVASASKEKYIGLLGRFWRMNN